MSELFKQIRPGLFYVEYDDFDFDKAAEMTNERYRPSGPMCSGIRKGDCIGRNADVYAGFDTVLVMRLSRRCARYSSIGIVTDYLVPTLDDMIAAQKKDDTYHYLPQMVIDGINEKGVSIMMFMVPNGEASENKSSWGGREWGRSAAYTNPSAAKTYNTMLLARLVLDNAANVEEAVVKGFDNGRGSQYLCAFYIAGKEIDSDEFRAHLDRLIPKYMHLGTYVRMESFSLNANGKVNRLILKEPERKTQDLHEEPKTEREATLLDIARKVMGTEELGVTDNLKDFGMDSLSATQIANQAIDKGIIIRMRDMMIRNSIRELAN